MRPRRMTVSYGQSGKPHNAYRIGYSTKNGIASVLGKINQKLNATFVLPK